MTKRAGNSPTVKSLTKIAGETGKPYTRRDEVERQIVEVLPFDDRRIFERLKNRQRDSDGYLLDETIVYLLRKRRDEEFFRETLYAELNRRIWKLFLKFRKNFNDESDFEDFGQTIEMTIIKNIFSETGTGDYAQVYFGDFVVKTATYAWYAQLKNIKRDESMFEMKRADDDEEEAAKADENRFVSTEMSSEERMILRTRIAEIPETIRNAAILHYLDGWRIESNDPKEPTISKLMNVSSRTIRNWLAQAREILAAQ
jgi:RNA polymerase sigma factor (sigma-70 family)